MVGLWRWWWVAAAVAVVTCGAAGGFILEGSPSSFAQFPRWIPGPNGSIEFEFSTREPSGLILYTDDGGSYMFFEIKLVDGGVRLQYNLGGGSRLMTVGRGLDDGAWHRVKVSRNYDRTSLMVDGAIESRSAKSLLHDFGTPSSNSNVFVGGLPDLLTRQVGAKLTLPVITLEPRFAGQFRNLVYTGIDGNPKVQDMITSQGVRVEGSVGECEKRDPCMNGGRCYTSASRSVLCDCSRLGFDGQFCEKERGVEEATFRGREFVWWDLRRRGGQPLASQQDQLSLSFKTRHPAGVLFFTGDGKDYVNVALREGGVLVTLDMGGDPLKISVKPNSIRFDDNQWHTVTVHRTVKEINGHTSFCTLSVSVDGMYTEKGTTAGPFSQLSSSRLNLAGAEVPALLPGAETRSNFKGCMRKAEYRADSVRLNLIRMVREGSSLLHVSGKVDFMCLEVEAGLPVAFTTLESYLDGPGNGEVKFTRPDAVLVLPSWEATRQGSVSFKMRTSEPDGLLMFNSGAISSQGDFFALEMLEGHIYLHLNLGSGSRRVKATSRRVDDGNWHEVTLNRDLQAGRITVDEGANDFTTPGDSHHLDLDGALYVGGVGVSVDVAPEVWSGRLGLGYVGCMRDLVINGQASDLTSYAKKQDSGSIVKFCHSDGGSCASSPCMHGGLCRQGWGRFVCDCSHTAFVGPTCGKNAATLNFNGGQYFKVVSREELSTQAEDISFRFRTDRPSGLLLATTSAMSSDKIELALQSGMLRLTVKLGDRDKVVHAGSGLNDKQWHTVQLKRRATQIRLHIDKDAAVPEHTMGRHSILQYRDVHIGMIHDNSLPPPLASDGAQVVSPFIGEMQSFYMNGEYLFEMARAGHVDRFEVTAEFGRSKQVVHHPVTFKSKSVYVSLPQLKAYASTNIYFQFKTLQPNGLIMYNSGKEHDFIALELVNGHVHLIFNLGERPVRIRDNSKMALNDNKWHAVTVSRPSPREHTLLMVDDNIATATSSGGSDTLDLQGFLYLGGVPPEMYTGLPRHVESRTGFEGCIASLDLNGESPDPAGKDFPQIVNQVYPGCDGPSTKCHRNACGNGGTCVQLWNSYSCNCDMTSFTGPTCSDESTAYEFGGGSGLMTFQYPDGRWPDTRRDLLALGFMTSQEDAVMLRLDSANSNDYMELEIVDGNIFMIYNMGTEDHPIGEVMSKVNDGVYHVVKFIRSGSNATVQVDDYEVRAKNPTENVQLSDIKILKKLRSRIWHGHQLSVFNAQSRLQIGGRRAKRSTAIERPFRGVMSGLVLNGERPLDLAAERDPRVSVRGDVHLLLGVPKELPVRSKDELNYWQRTPSLPGPKPGDGDDLVFSGAGSGCDIDDEDECIPVFETGSGDDLITPVYIPPTMTPVTKRPPPPDFLPERDLGPGVRPCDDEEDCYIGSGSGEFNTDEGGAIGTAELDLEPSSTNQPLVKPGSIDSDEHNSRLNGGKKDPGSGATTTRHPGVFAPGTTTTTTTTTPRPRLHEPLGSTTAWSYPEQPQQPTIEYDYEDYRFPDPDPGPPKGPGVGVKVKEDPRERLHSDTSGVAPLIISIIAGALIIVILIILLILKIKGRRNGGYKVDETKNYEGIPAVPTPAMVNGQGNGNIKPGDRRPIKKQCKDIKEWYV